MGLISDTKLDKCFKTHVKRLQIFVKTRTNFPFSPGFAFGLPK